jgi:hypothetical protein
VTERLTTGCRWWGTLLLCVVSCVTPVTTRTAPHGEWVRVLDASNQAALAGRYADADSILTTFSHNYDGSREALEADYWRAVFMLDPANRNASLEAGIASLDKYLSASPPPPHRREATTLRRLASQFETVSKLAAANTTTPTSAPRTVIVDDHSKDDEIARLKAELAKANEELERIKKRLATPKP